MVAKAERAIDGGRTALGGFFFQMVGAWSMVAWAETLEQSPDGSELEATLRLLREGGVAYHEAFDEDLLIDQSSLGIEPADQYILVQFKYSRDPARHPIRPSEIKKIAASFERSKTKAEASGHKVSRYLVLTNRPSPRIEKTGIQKDGSLPSSNPPFASVTVKDITMTFVTDLQETLLYEKLRRFAHRFGCNEYEVERGIDQLVGRLSNPYVYTPATPLRREVLAEAFTGFAQPHPLTSQCISGDEDEARHMRTQQQRLQIRPTPIERTALDDLDRRVLERALILLTGLGGVGKSTTLWEWVERQRGKMSHGLTPIACLRRGDEVRDNYLAQIFRLWANDKTGYSSRANDAPIQALERLQVANPSGSHPVFVLALDGLDEDIAATLTAPIRDLVSWFFEEDQSCRSLGRPPKATLLITCRDMKQFSDNWLGNENPGLAYGAEDDLEPLPIRQFSWQELRDGARLHADELVSVIEQRMQHEAGKTHRYSGSSYDTLSTDAYTSSYALPVTSTLLPLSQPHSEHQSDVDMLSLLCHPVLWAEYIACSQADRALIQDGSSAGLKILAHRFVKRFCTKARQRGIKLPEPAIAEMLRSIVQRCHPDIQTFSFRQWCDAVTDVHAVATALWDEAVTTGLIRVVSAREWQWAQGLIFVCAYLEEVGGMDLLPRRQEQV